MINCETMQKTYCDENYDERDLIACAERLGNEIIKIAGDMGGGLKTGSEEVNSNCGFLCGFINKISLWRKVI